MTGWLFIEFSTFLLLCALLLPLVWMTMPIVWVSIKIRLRRSGPPISRYVGYRPIDQAALIAVVLGIPGVILEIVAGMDKTKPGPGWVFIGLGSFFLICTFAVPILWLNLTHKLAPSAELEGIKGCLYILFIAIILGLLSSVLLVIGILTLGR